MEARESKTLHGDRWRGVTAIPQLVLLLVIVAGVLARIIGLPVYIADSGDEWGNTIAPFRVLFERGDPNVFFHPSLYYYVTAAVYAAVFSAVKAIGVVDASLSMTDLFVLDERYFVFAARSVSLLCGALAIYALYALAQSLWRRHEGLMAGALLAVLPLHVLYSKTVRVDSLFLLLFIFAFSRIVRILSHPDQATYDKAGFLTGLATGANYNGAVLALWLVAAHFLQGGDGGVSTAAAEDPSPKGLGMRRLHRALWIMLVAFIVSSPFTVLNIKTFVENFSFISGLSLAEHPGWESRDLLFYAADLVRVNPSLCVLIGVSCLALAFFGNRTERFVLSLPVGYLMLFSFMRSKDSRFILPAMALFLAVASGLPFVLSKRFSPHRISVILLSTLSYVLLFVCIGTMAVQSIPIAPQHEMLSRPDGVLFDWIEKNVPPRSTILVESGIVPLIDILKTPGRFAAELRKSIVAIHPNLDQQFIGAVYVGGCNYEPDMLATKHIDYAIISQRNVHYIETQCDTFPKVCGFYRELRASGRPVFETPGGFEPVLIYEIRP